MRDAKILFVERGLAKTLIPNHRTTAAAWIAGMAQLPRDDWHLLGIAAAGRGGLNTIAKGTELKPISPTGMHVLEHGVT